MRFSAVSALSFLGLALLAECSPVGLDTREANNLPRVIDAGAVLSRDMLHARAVPKCPARRKSSVRREASPEADHDLSRRKVTEDDVLDQEVKYCNKQDEIVEIKNEIAAMTPGSSAVKAKKKELKKAENALAQIKTKWDRLEDQLAKGK